MPRSLRTIRVSALIASAIFAWTARSAFANTYNFTIGPDVSGTFTTSTASPTDPGYFLITGIDITSISGTTDDGTSFHYTDQVDPTIDTLAAYDPTTGAFINHEFGNTYNDSGTIDSTDIFDFSGLGSTVYDGIDSDDPNIIGDGFTVSGSLSVTPAVAATPEPAAWSLMLLGLAGVPALRFRRRI